MELTGERAPRVDRGEDVIVAHNGYDFDFRILKRIATSLGERFDLCTYDTLPLARDLFPTSRKLVDLARLFGVPPGQSHRALDDTLALAKIVVALDEVKRSRARTTALVNLLDHLGVALALCDEELLGDEAESMTDQDIEDVRRDIERDKILTAQEALEYGLVDQVISSRKASVSV